MLFKAAHEEFSVTNPHHFRHTISSYFAIF